MDKKSCIYQIHEMLPHMTSKEKKVGEHILRDPKDAINPSIEELAERIGVSESTLFRFVRKLGYTGYQQFRIALVTESVDPYQRAYEIDIPKNDDESAIHLVFKTNMRALEQTKNKIIQQNIDSIADILISSNRVFFFGLGGSSIVAQDAYHKIIRLGIHCGAPVDFHLQLMQASQLEIEDTAFLISHTGTNKDALAIAETTKRSGAKLIILTNYDRSPLIKLADFLLTIHVQGSPYATEAFSARIVQLAVIDALYITLIEKMGKTALDQIEKMRETIAHRRT
jgi:DNA-binding MurR/RpiR family transcriptional regulator